MNILQVSSGELRIPVEEGGGIEAYVLHLSKALSQAGHNVVIVDRKYTRADPDVEYINGVKIVRLKGRRFPRFNFTIGFVLNQVLFARRVRKYLKKSDFDVIQLHQSVIGLALAIICRGWRSKLFYISQTSRRLKKPLGLMDRAALVLENQLAKRVRKVIVLNELVREKLIGEVRLNPANVVLLPVSIDISKFETDPDVDDIRRRYGLEGKINVLFVGRVHPDKGVEYLVKAANIVVNEFGCEKAQFMLVGPTEHFGSGGSVRSPYLTMILGLIEEYGLKQNVRLTGTLPFDDLRGLYAACDMFVLPSLTEAAPTAPLEAMASGRPVIGTRVGGIPMQIQDGKGGFLVDPADERQLAEKIKYLIDNPSEAEGMGAYGRRIVEEQFSSEKVAERLLEVYQGQE